jgi:hypothetical protein
MEGGVEWPCRYCGGWFVDLSEHYPKCEARRRAEALADLRRLEAMEAAGLVPIIVADPVDPDRTLVVMPPKVKGKGGRPRKHADRLAYMKAYMRARRAKVIS